MNADVGQEDAQADSTAAVVLATDAKAPVMDPAAAVEPYSMLDWATVERARIADGTEFVLGRYGDDWVIRVGANILMSNRMHSSEESLAEVALEKVPGAQTVLVGGLGLGYTTRAVLDRVSADAKVFVSELVPELVDWNHRYLGALAGYPLADRRCKVVVGDVFDELVRSPSFYDAILLDVDNGPRALTQAKNQRLYGDSGSRACLAALKPGGVLAVWSSGPNARYQRKLAKQAAEVEVRSVPARVGSKVLHSVLIGRRPGP
jgi:spermidine synthase